MRAVVSAPYDHLLPCPDGSVSVSTARGVECADRGPGVGSRVVTSSVGGEQVAVLRTSPNDHLVAGPYRNVITTRARRSRQSRRSPGIRRRIVARSVSQEPVVISAPDNHLAARPNCGVPVSTDRRTN